MKNIQIIASQFTYTMTNSEILAKHDGGIASSTRYFYLHDRLGSVREILDNQGSIVKTYTYSAYGETIKELGSFDNLFMFTGQWYDPEIGQYYLRARMYDPYLARFTSRYVVCPGEAAQGECLPVVV